MVTVARTLARSAVDGAAMGVLFPLHHVSRWMGRPVHTTHVRGAGRIRLRPDSSDAEVIADIFRRRNYDFSWLPQYQRVLGRYQRILAAGRTPLIVDAGANIGAASIWFAERFPEAHVFAVEPDPDNIAVLRMNATDRASITVVPAAIGSRAGTATLSNSEHDSWAIQSARDDLGSIPIVTIPEVITGHTASGSLFLVKVDIEGFEADLFAENLEWLDDVEVLIVEPHDWMLPGARTSRNFQIAMLDRDFEVIVSGENLIYLRLDSSLPESAKG